MLSYFRHSASAVLTKVLTLIGMYPPPECFEASYLLAGSVAIGQYFEYLRLQYKDSTVEHLERLRVSEVRLFKKKPGAEHEYISAKVMGPKGFEFYLAFERFRGKKISSENSTYSTSQKSSVDSTSPMEQFPVEDEACQSTSDSYLVLTSCHHLSDSISPNRLANDQVTYIDKSSKGCHGSGDTVYRTLVFSKDPIINRPLYLYELVILATTLHTVEDQYLIGTKQCYFYAGTIVQVLQEVYGVKADLTVTVYTTGSPEMDEAHALSAKRPFKDKAGKWKGIPIYANLPSSNVTQLCHDFTKNAEEFKQKVENLNRERIENGRRYTEMQRRIETLERQIAPTTNLS